MASPVSQPADFAARSWAAYLECVREGSYYFSVDELVAICTQAQVNVAVFKQLDEVLTYAGGGSEDRAFAWLPSWSLTITSECGAISKD